MQVHRHAAAPSPWMTCSRTFRQISPCYCWIVERAVSWTGGRSGPRFTILGTVKSAVGILAALEHTAMVSTASIQEQQGQRLVHVTEQAHMPFFRLIAAGMGCFNVHELLRPRSPRSFSRNLSTLFAHLRDHPPPPPPAPVGSPGRGCLSPPQAIGAPSTGPLLRAARVCESKIVSRRGLGRDACLTSYERQARQRCARGVAQVQ